MGYFKWFFPPSRFDSFRLNFDQFNVWSLIFAIAFSCFFFFIIYFNVRPAYFLFIFFFVCLLLLNFVFCHRYMRGRYLDPKWKNDSEKNELKCWPNERKKKRRKGNKSFCPLSGTHRLRRKKKNENKMNERKAKKHKRTKSNSSFQIKWK